MSTQDVKDILALDRIVEAYPHTPDGKHGLIAALLDWKHDNGTPDIGDPGSVAPATPTRGAVAQRASKAKADRATRASAKAADPDEDVF
jgi:hypothetical protein